MISKAQNQKSELLVFADFSNLPYEYGTIQTRIARKMGSATITFSNFYLYRGELTMLIEACEYGRLRDILEQLGSKPLKVKKVDK